MDDSERYEDAGAPAAVTVGPEGLVAGGRTLPLFAGAIHYWRLDPQVWPRALDALADLGLRMACTYVPWEIHEVEPGRFDFGETDVRRDLGRFLDLCAERGLAVLLRPGPHVNAELTSFGFPPRVLADPRCQARSARGSRVLVPAPPRAFPAPSLASPVFRDEARTWLLAFADRVRPRLFPAGPVVGLQADNEATFFFRTGAFDQDYSEAAVAAFRRWLARRYPGPGALAEAWGAPGLEAAAATPPTALNGGDRRALAPALDWLRFKEDLVLEFVGQAARTLREAGLGTVPLFHNLPMGDGGTPADLASLEREVDLVGVDLYHPRQQLGLVRETVLHLAGTSRLPFVPELGVGAPWYLPALSVEDGRQLLLAALAYGTRAANLYMIVDRDRWYGAPVSGRGVRREDVAGFYRRLLGALARVRWHALRRPARAVLLRDRSEGRLAAASNPFDPFPPGALRVAGFEAEAQVGEGTFGYPRPPALVAARARARLDQALRAAGLAHVFTDDALAPGRLPARPLVCVAAPGFLSAETQGLLLTAARAGGAVVLGPDLPVEAEAGRPCDRLVAALGPGVPADRPLPHVRHPCGAGVVIQVPALDAADPAALAALLATLGEDLGLPTEPAPGDAVDALWHRGAQATVLALVNRGETEAVVRGEAEAEDLVDLADGTRFGPGRPVPLAPGSVRLLEVVG